MATSVGEAVGCEKLRRQVFQEDWDTLVGEAVRRGKVRFTFGAP